MNERIAYMNGMSTGYSSGYRAAMAWYAPKFGMGCNIHVPVIPATPRDIHSDIYAMDYWLTRHIHEAGFHLNLSGATHVFIPSSMKKKAQLIRMHQDKTFVVNDFGPFCRFQRLGQYKNVRFLMMSPGDGGCRTNKVDIIAPHTVAWNDDPTEVKRKYRIFFRGHLPKPYINPAISELRYRIYKDLYNTPNSMIESYNVEENVNALTTSDRTKLCTKCSYRCKTCYFSEKALEYKNAKMISSQEFRSFMRMSVFCIVSRGDNPGCPKLGESIISGCIPVIIMDQALPFEKELNYSAFSIRFDTSSVMQNPSIIRSALAKIDEKRIYDMQQHLKLVSDMFAVRSGGSPFNMQTKLLHDICDVS